MSTTGISKRAVLTVGIAAAGWIFATPTTAQACSVTPDVVEEARVTQGDESCLLVETTHDPGDYDLPTLRIQNDCSDAIEVRIPHCSPCYENPAQPCFDCGQEWVQLEGMSADGPTELVFQLDFPIDDHVGETVESSIDWTRGEESGQLVIELDMADKHPTQQANEACPGLCSVSAKASPPALGALLILLGMWGRRRNRRATSA